MARGVDRLLVLRLNGTAEAKLNTKSPIRRIWRWLHNQMVQDVPEDSALCEFDCRKGQCTMEEWENCERRLAKAAGELMPSPRKNSAEHD